MMKKILLLFTVGVMVAVASHDVLARGGDRGAGPRPSRSGPSRFSQRPSGPARSVQAQPQGSPMRTESSLANRPGRGVTPLPPKPRGYSAISRHPHPQPPHPHPHPRPPYPPYPHHHHHHYYPGWQPVWWTYPAIITPWWSWNTSGPFYNPYATSAGDPVYNYTQVIYPYYSEEEIKDQEATAVKEEEKERETLAMRYFEIARDAFKVGNYPKAIEQVNRSIRLLPRDAAFHEFRALALFALGKFNQAAAVISSVLASGPGWNWDTMIDLYGDPETYTKQLRALEDFVKQYEKDPAAKFLLAYQYLVMGYNDSARAELEEVVRLQPKDILAQRMLTTLDKAQKKTDSAPAPPKPQ